MKFKNFISPPYNLLLALGSMIAIVSFFWKGQMDLHINDTYFVVSGTIVLWATAISLVAVWLLYLPLDKILCSVVLTWIHVGSILLFIIAVFIGMFFYDKVFASSLSNPRTIYAYMQDYNRKVRIFFGLPTLLLLLGQLAFVINIVAGAARIIHRRNGHKL